MYISFWRPPSWISGGCRRHATPEVASGTIKKFDPENIVTAVGILLLCALELEICLGVKYLPAAGKRRQKNCCRDKG